MFSRKRSRFKRLISISTTFLYYKNKIFWQEKKEELKMMQLKKYFIRNFFLCIFSLSLSFCLVNLINSDLFLCKLRLYMIKK